jgi:hypothetical protein
VFRRGAILIKEIMETSYAGFDLLSGVSMLPRFPWVEQKTNSERFSLNWLAFFDFFHQIQLERP